jgi:PPOX class probable F420-dependent enzyme
MTTVPSSHRDLADQSGIAVLTTIGPRGGPQSTAVGFWYDSDLFRISAPSGRQKVINLGRNPACSLFIVDPTNPYRTMEVRAEAEVVDDSSYEWAAHIAESNGATVDDVRQTTPPGQVQMCVVLHPTKVVTVG